MFCGILSRCNHQSVHQLAITRFAIMCENASSTLGSTPMETQTDERDIEIDADDEISVGSVSPAPAPCDTDESMPLVNENININESDKKESIGKDDIPESSVSPGVPMTPPVAHQSNANVPRSLKFSIDNILKPDFGKRSSESSGGADQPVDLSRVTNENTQTSSVSSLVGQQTISDKPKPYDKESSWPAWVYCTRYSDRPSAGPRTRRIRKREKKDEKRPRTAFTSDQLARLKKEFQENRYLTEKRRQDLARELGLNESQIKIWFQNKRAKIKKVIQKQDLMKDVFPLRMAQ